jgi:hypothetical protein
MLLYLLILETTLTVLRLRRCNGIICNFKGFSCKIPLLDEISDSVAGTEKRLLVQISLLLTEYQRGFSHSILVSNLRSNVDVQAPLQLALEPQLQGIRRVRSSVQLL